MIVIIMAILVPIIAIGGVIATKRTDEVEPFAMRFGAVAVVGAIVSIFMHLGIAFTISAGVCGLALLGYFVMLRRETA
jgi:hypothetical protein